MQKNKSLLISIIIPTHNNEQFIEDSIKSCYRQTIDDKMLEVIVINDASTDNTAGILQDLQNKYPIIVEHLEDNSGPASARNAGLQMARGEYIAFLDADDMMKENKLESQLNYLSGNAEVNLVITGIEEVTENGRFVRNLIRPFPHNKEEQIKAIFLESLHGITPTMFFKRQVLNSVGIMDSRMLNMEDMDYVIRILKDSNIYYLPESLTIRRLTCKGASSSVSEQVFLDSRTRFYQKATRLFHHLLQYRDEFWAKNYFRLGRILQGQGNIKKARYYFFRSFKVKINLYGIIGWLLSFFPRGIQKTLAIRTWRRT